MLTPFDDTPWHQIATPFDQVGSSDPRFFDRIWFAATDPSGTGTLQCTLGVYQNMNVVDGGFVVIADGRQHNVRVSRELRPRYETASGPLRIDVIEPLQRIRLRVEPGDHGVAADLEWRAVLPPEEEPQHFVRKDGRVVEDYHRFDQIGECHGWVDVGTGRRPVDSWWACRDHSWGVRQGVGIPEPVTSTPTAVGGGGHLFAFLFYSTDTHGGHVQVARRLDGHEAVSVRIGRRDATTEPWTADDVDVHATFVDDGRPRRISHGAFVVGDTRLELDALGPAIAMPGLGYSGGYDDGLGLGVWRGVDHLEAEVWDVSRPAEVGYPDGSTGRPVHRIQPVRVTQHGPDGTSTGVGSLTFIAEGDLDALRISPDARGDRTR
jgi:hypothetical protein